MEYHYCQSEIEVEEAFPPGIEPGSWNDMFSALPLSYGKAFQQSVRKMTPMFIRIMIISYSAAKHTDRHTHTHTIYS